MQSHVQSCKSSGKARDRHLVENKKNVSALSQVEALLHLMMNKIIDTTLKLNQDIDPLINDPLFTYSLLNSELKF